jgi:stage II sporulation protein D
VGLSQFGAKGMADRGYRYAQILEHYYPGTTLVTLP